MKHEIKIKFDFAMSATKNNCQELTTYRSSSLILCLLWSSFIKQVFNGRNIMEKITITRDTLHTTKTQDLASMFLELDMEKACHKLR